MKVYSNKIVLSIGLLLMCLTLLGIYFYPFAKGVVIDIRKDTNEKIRIDTIDIDKYEPIQLGGE